VFNRELNEVSNYGFTSLTVKGYDDNKSAMISTDQPCSRHDRVLHFSVVATPVILIGWSVFACFFALKVLSSTLVLLEEGKGNTFAPIISTM
jgi:hypothetical protein